MKKDDAIYTTSLFSGIPLSDFMDIVLSKDKRADEAMYYLLHHCLNFQLRQRFEVYRNQLLDDFDDVIDDFFLYLREGKEGNNQQTYQSLRCIEKKESFESWLLNTFRNYLSGRAAKERNFFCSELPVENIADGDATSSAVANEEKLSIASDLIAYAHQEFFSRDRFILLRTLLTLLNKRQALPNEVMARTLEMTDVSYRVTVYRMKCRLAEYRSCLLQGKKLRLDDKHQQMARQINDDFSHLYPTLLGYYSQAIDSLTCSEAVKQLRQEYYVTTGNIMHESNAPYSANLSIEAFWNKLNRFLMV